MTGPDSQPLALIVGIGASAGGLAAFQTFLANTPADTGMAFVLVQHLDPHHKSLLVELLATHSPIPVMAARDGLAVKRNYVFVIPPDATLTIKGGVLQLATPAPAREHRRPIDTFFISLAEDCGERAVGIVLAGVGSDGTIGIKTIKEHGGLTLAQAEFDATALQGMPSSAVSTGVVDHVVLVEEMPGKLADYQRHLIEVAERKDGDGNRRDIQEHLPSITSLLHARSEHDFSGYKETTLIRRLQRRMQVLHIDSVPDYVERLRTDQAEVAALFRELLIGVTQFFRDPEAFDALKAMAIMPLLGAKDEVEPIRVWVPGCSTGEEVYSLAILLREVLQEHRATREVKIFGTDIDANAVAFARASRYKAVTSLSPERLERWFARDGDDYCPVPQVRDMCVFSTHSLVKDPPFSKLDLVSCRNVLIYLDNELQDRLMHTFHYALVPGGYLFLGNSESVTRNSRLFTALDKKHRVLQRRASRAVTLPAFQPGVMRAGKSLELLPLRRRSAEDMIDKAITRLMQQYAPAYMIIDRNHDITRFSGAETRHYLEPTQGAASLNLFSIVLQSLRPAVRAAVSQALADGQRIVNENLTIDIDGKARPLTLIVEPIGGENGAKTSGVCMVAFRHTAPPAATETAQPAVAASDANTQALERELRATKAQLQTATDELETRIEDMKSATEEFQAVNEELQSSNEELETSKEEMQSINEELQTINNELNNKNELLTRAAADLQNLLDSTQIATVFLDDELRIRHFTPNLGQLFSVRDSDRGRPITEIVTQLDYATIRTDVEKVQRDGSVVERDLAVKESARAYVMRIRPYRTIHNVTEGVVITFVDITDRKRAEIELAANEAQLRLSQQAARMGSFLWEVATDRVVRLGDVYATWGLPAGEGLQSQWLALVHPDDRLRIQAATSDALTGQRAHLDLEYRIDAHQLHWIEEHGEVLRDADGRPVQVVGIRLDVTDRKLAEERQAILARELQHRTKNLIQVIQSIADRSLSGDRPLGAAREAFVARLRALGNAQELLTETEWQGAPLEQVIARELQPFAARVSMEGPFVVLSSSASQGFALVIHELGTNATKHGALSAPAGKVAIRWSVEEENRGRPTFTFCWQERGGPTVRAAPATRGFGTTLLEHAIGGIDSARIDYAREGLSYIVEAPLSAIAAQTWLRQHPEPWSTPATSRVVARP
jgi:two-component system, chemotaxis family, CheB/CheR fusion protein